MTLPQASIVQRQRPSPSATFVLRSPCAADGRSVHALIAACPPLDANSLYLNLLQCTHFADTCVLAQAPDSRGSPAGFISGYRQPDHPDTLFIWQVAIAPDARGCGLAKRMLLALLDRPSCTGVTRIETTITQSNDASWALFRSTARLLGAPLESRVLFDRDQHLDGVHGSELLVTIGPILPRGDSVASHSRRSS